MKVKFHQAKRLAIFLVLYFLNHVEAYYRLGIQINNSIEKRTHTIAIFPMPWPIPVFPQIEYPKPLFPRVWLPTLAAIASAAAAAVLLLWPHGKPTNTFQFWGALAGAPLVVCLAVFGWKLDRWEDEQTDAEEGEEEQYRLKGMWRDWTRRRLCVVDVAAFPAATAEIAEFAKEKIELPTNSKRTIAFDWVKGRAAAFRRTRLLHLIGRRFAETLRGRREVIVTLMLDDASLKQAEAWTRRVVRVFSVVVPKVTFHVEVRSATGGVHWIARQVDRIDAATRLLIAVQLWADEAKEKKHAFSEGAAAFLIEPGARKAGLIFRPMTCAKDTLETGLAQIDQYQMALDHIKQVWVAGGGQHESTAIRSGLAPDPRDVPAERLLDDPLGNPGPASGWIGLAIAMEAMRGAGPQLVAWREPGSEILSLCTISPLPQKKETTV